MKNFEYESNDFEHFPLLLLLYAYVATCVRVNDNIEKINRLQNIKQNKEAWKFININWPPKMYLIDKAFYILNELFYGDIMFYYLSLLTM